jgi:sensor histidine kinase YesM
MEFLHKRIPPGYKIGEALAYVLFCLFWPIALGTVYYLGSAFNADTFIPLHIFVYTNLISFSAKLLLIIPVWWLYFRVLKHKPLGWKIALHIITGILFSTSVVWICKTGYHVFLHALYPKTFMLSDFYTFAVYYFFHVSLFHGYNFYLDQKAQLIKEKQLQALAYESEIKALKSQIEPHFLFNTLNSISASIPRSMEKTRVMIAQLADTFRHALEASEQDMIPLREELAFINTWLSLEKQRFGERLQIHFSIDKRCLDAKLPPMLLQPLVENAVKHGISPKVDGGQITIECRCEDAFAVIAVSDTGIGFDGRPEQMFTLGVGLSNISKRLTLLYNEPLQVQQQEPGLKFFFRIPTNKKAATL